ncbi:MAG: TIGR02597 family protein [Verrucomicrobiae bacterium]|nr:TIGR02597 family protein [Verrucomicrobiae bacterium]
MKINLSKIFGISLVVLGTTSSLESQTVTTAPVGFVRYNALANSDIYVTPPFERPAFWSGTIASVSGNVVTLNNASLTPNQLVYAAGTQPNTYYLRIGSHSSINPKEGNYYTITANGTNTVTLDLAGDNISSIAPGTKAKIIPYWTLNTLFPNGQGINASPSEFSIQTRVIVPNILANGINLPASSIFYYLGPQSQWRKIGSTANQNDTIINPDNYVIIRSAASPSQFAIAGNVSMEKNAYWLRTQNSQSQDNPLGLPRPMPVKLVDAGFISSGAFASSPSEFNITDRLIVFDNTTTGINKPAKAVYYYTNNQWRKVGSTGNAGNDEINLYEGVVIRKAPVTNGPTIVGINSPNY